MESAGLLMNNPEETCQITVTKEEMKPTKGRLKCYQNPKKGKHYHTQPLCDGDDEVKYKPEQIMIGPKYQAVIPKGPCPYDEPLPYDKEDQLLWAPAFLSETKVEDFLRKAGTIPSADNEHALHCLLQAEYEPDDALRMLSDSSPDPNETFTSPPTFTEDECAQFEDGLGAFGKDFHLIQLFKVQTRSIAELVHFYYFWKKSERFDLFPFHHKLVDFKRKKNDNNKNYRRKDKIPLNPNYSDFMGRFLDHDLNLITDSTVRLGLLNVKTEPIEVKQEPFIKEEKLDE